MATPKTAKTTSVKKVRVVQPERKPSKWTKPFRAVGSYFKGAWVELRQVRWPDRKSTWGLTLAVIIFSLFFALVILGLDAVFSYLFKEVLL
ncbi:MAG: preprotein translocase subunit SecE [Candidatus Saccharimonadales bacterium]